MRAKRKASILLRGRLLAVRFEVRYLMLAGRVVRVRRQKVVRFYAR